MMRILLLITGLLLSSSCAINRTDVTVQKIEFECTIEFISNQIPGSNNDGKNKMYAIVRLKAKQDKTFKTNWKLKDFTIEGKGFTEFDSDEMMGKDQKMYKNNVREIGNVPKPPFKVHVQFLNENLETLEFDKEIKSILEVG